MYTSGKWFCVRVRDLQTSKVRTNLRTLLNLAEFGMQMVTRYAPSAVEYLNVEAIIAAVKSGREVKLLNIKDEEKDQLIEVFVEQEGEPVCLNIA